MKPHSPRRARAAPARHPRGLYVLFATEMWERFSFYTMLALFTLYLQDKARGLRLDGGAGDDAARQLPAVRLLQSRSSAAGSRTGSSATAGPS